jgi:hypothetical protein
MGLISRQFTYSAGAVIVASQHNTNENDLFNLVNGGLTTANLSASAGIVDTQLAQVTSAGKISGAALTSLSSIPSGAGVIPTANLPTIASAADQAAMEAASSTTTYVSPGLFKNHPGAAKAWCMFNGTTTGTNAPTVGYNVTSVTRNSAGNYTANLTTAMSSVNYAICVIAGGISSNANSGHPSTLLTTSATFYFRDSGGSSNDSSVVMFFAFGDQ